MLPRWFRTDAPEQTAVAMRRAVRGAPDRAPPGGRLEPDHRARDRGELPAPAATCSTRVSRARASCSARAPASRTSRLYGQLTQLVAFDPTPAAIALAAAPRVVAWVDLVEDLSGVEPGDGDWIGREAIPDDLRALFGEVGRVYAPFLLANAEALAQGAAQVHCVIDGQPWEQQPFPYQGKCLAWLRAAHVALDPDARAVVDAVLDGTGCERLFG